jgi:hypothetical protein
VKREAPSNSKIKRLCRLLDIPLYHAVGLLELLWHLTAREATRGDIGKLDNESIALALDYRGDEDKLIDALVRCGWLDESTEHRLVVHDWHEHADEAVKKRLTRSKRSFIGGPVATEPENVETKWQSGNLPRAGAGPEPEPSPVPDKKKSALVPSAPSAVPADPTPPLFDLKSPEKKQRTPEEYAAYWNETVADLLPQVDELNEERRRKLNTRIKHGLTPQKFRDVLHRVLATPFLNGDNDKCWRADFDFVIRSDTTIARILNGFYGGGAKRARKLTMMPDPLEEICCDDTRVFVFRYRRV